MVDRENRYFRVITGLYRKSEYVSIKEDELEKAIYAFATEKKVFLAGRPVNGKSIIDIIPDYSKNLGLNPSHAFGSDYSDYELAHREGIMNMYEGVQENATAVVRYLIKTKQVDLLGTNFQLPDKNVELLERKKQLTGIKKM